MKKLAICIPTFKRPAHIKEYLEMSLVVLEKLAIDVYIYDSSDDDETENVVEEFRVNHNNLFIVKVESSVPSNVKILNIWSDETILNGYDYVWMMGDSLRWSEQVYRRVCAELDNNYPLIITDTYDHSTLGTVVLHDKQVVFEKCAHYLTLYGACILKTDTFLKGVDWEYIRKKYCDDRHIGFSQLGVYFERLSQMEEINVLNLCCVIDYATISSGLESNNHWRSTDFFNVLLGQWVNTIRDLPSCYKNKTKVIGMYEYYTHFINLQALKQMRSAGTYGIRQFFKYFFRWKICTAVPRMELFKTAIIPIKGLTKLYDPREKISKLKEEEICEHMISFSKKYKKIYVYGAGKIAKRRIEVLRQNGINVESVFVSNNVHEENLDGIDICAYEQGAILDDDYGIIFCLGFYNMFQVLSSYFLGHDKNNLFTECVYANDQIRTMTDYYEYIDPKLFVNGNSRG
ncbi:hypothetical protein SAMN02745247_00633 [Butyrivibrio hungatei DSM 14810]|uniref:Glycosyl transferase family 2 n=1 Tax=Butyrivibrio hungatei DSM 14810 TaxID=1121132 RepID=A0A1M7RXV6_9FIRM|nr:hypothetical protein [Butyrivibrio hungatei]SHN51045.1 hypothetical protein SAMN02745247_00633 [Butyrivibrio hungatei DSM 14810]